MLEFPDGQIGIVDAYPSNTASRPDILEITRDRETAFVCLTHPHEDHGLDLVRILENQQVKEFWYSFSPADKLIFHVTQHKKFLSPEREWAEEIKLGWAKFMLDILDPVERERVYPRSLNESSKSIEIAGVKIHFLAPSHRFIATEESRLERCLKDPGQPAPDINGFSLIMGLEYGKSFVLLGSDGLRTAWKGVRDSWSKSRLPPAIAMKVPHHGAKNAFDLRPANQKPINCWDLCANEVKAILFAGDSKHPNEEVRKRLEEKTDLISLLR